jgi:hypothetical protein
MLPIGTHLGYMWARPSATMIIFNEEPTCTNSGESNSDTNSSVSLLRWLEEATMRKPGSSKLWALSRREGMMHHSRIIVT